MAAVGVQFGRFGNEGWPGNVTMHGQTYHRVLNGSDNCPLSWFIHDADWATRRAEKRSIDAYRLRMIRNVLEDINPYIASLVKLGSDRLSAEAHVHLEYMPQSSEVACVVRYRRPGKSRSFGLRHIIVKKISDDKPYYIKTCSPFWEPLQYPLFFPGGQYISQIHSSHF